jgi:hypothetical protein
VSGTVPPKKDKKVSIGEFSKNTVLGYWGILYILYMIQFFWWFPWKVPPFMDGLPLKIP